MYIKCCHVADLNFSGPYHSVSVKDSVLTELESYGDRASAHKSLQITFADTGSNEEQYNAIVSRDPKSGKFTLEEFFRPDKNLAKFTSDLVCLERYVRMIA